MSGFFSKITAGHDIAVRAKINRCVPRSCGRALAHTSTAIAVIAGLP